MGADCLFRDTISKTVNSLFQGRSNLELLEAGCGSASYFDFAGVCKSSGIDISNEQLEKNTAIQQKILGDLQTYPLSKDEFDIVVCWDVIEHLPRPQDALRNMFNAAKPGGLVILGFPKLNSFKGLATKFTPFWFHKAYHRYMKTSSRHFPTYMRLAILPHRVIRYAQENGFSIVYRELLQGSVTQQFLERFPKVGLLLRMFDGLWRTVTFGKCSSIFIDSCALILKKDIKSVVSG